MVRPIPPLANFLPRILRQWSPWGLSVGFIPFAILFYLIFTWGSPGGWGLKDKTRWDWLNLLGAPLLLSAFGFWLQQWQKYRDKNQQGDEILHEFFDQLSSLLIERDILSAPEKDAKRVRPVVRARTLSVLRRLTGDSERKGYVMRFLSETGILSELKVSLSGADLEEANLNDINLSHAILNGAKLKRAKLKGANLAGANLSPIDIKGDIRDKVNLTWRTVAELNQAANLTGADLRNAFLVKADLKGVDLAGADLRGAVLGFNPLGGPILNGADITGADFKGILWDGETRWPDPEKFKDVRNIPPALRRELGLP